MATQPTRLRKRIQYKLSPSGKWVVAFKRGWSLYRGSYTCNILFYHLVNFLVNMLLRQENHNNLCLNIFMGCLFLSQTLICQNKANKCALNVTVCRCLIRVKTFEKPSWERPKDGCRHRVAG